MPSDFLLRVVKRSVVGRGVRAFYHPAYRLPLGGVEGTRGIEPRRADLVRWWGLYAGFASHARFRLPPMVAWEDLSRVHTPRLLEDIASAEGLARIYGVDTAEVEVESLLQMVRLATGGTVEAARAALRTGRPMLNLLGGFHHAGPDRAGGFCPVNDIAVALAAVRFDGFSGRAAVIDLDAHPPDGTAACLEGDKRAWVGSLSGSDWGPLPGADETVLPVGCPDRAYLDALRGLLARMPQSDLVFVIAGGDVLAGDPLGRLGLSLDGAQQRDREVLRALHGRPSVWLPGGGYHADSWKVLAATAELVFTGAVRGPAHEDPMGVRFASVAGHLDRGRLTGERDAWLTQEELDTALGMRSPSRVRLMDFYPPEGIEYALYRYGILQHIERLGYHSLVVGVERSTEGDRLSVTGEYLGQRGVVMDCVLQRRTVQGQPVLFINWLELRHPRAAFSTKRPQLPGQTAPGLGMSREAVQMLAQMARRLGLRGILLRPAHFHVAYSARQRFAFPDARRQGRFLALLRDLAHLPLLEATRAIDEGRVKLNGAPYAWEADEMVSWLDGHPAEQVAEAEAEAARVHFTAEPPVNVPPR